MSEERKTTCPCGQQFDSTSALRAHLEKEHPGTVEALHVWGREIYPKPKSTAFIDSDTMKCCGCGLCAEACSMQHYGVMNKEWSRIYIRNVLLPLPKTVVVTCCQCQDEERLCEKACPLTPPVIYFDKKTLHMVVDAERCTGCLACQEACGTEAIRFDANIADIPFVCDLCDKVNTGERNPQCVQICPTGALYYHDRVERIRPIRDTYRKNSNTKAEFVARRLYPLTQDSLAYPPWQPDTTNQEG